MNASTQTPAQDLWKNHSEAWKASGITQQAYCDQEGMSYRSFVYQHNRLMSPSKKASLNFIETKPESAVISSHQQSSAVISSQASGLQWMRPHSIRIGIGAEITPVVLQTVLSLAGAVQCLR